MNSTPSKRVEELNLQLPPAPPPAGVYRPILVVDNFLYVSGQGPVKLDGSLLIGRAGDDLDADQAKLAARQVGLTMLSTIITHFGSLDRIKRVVKVLGMVNSTPDFGKQPYVVNGFSELMADVFGKENGIGVRSAVGMMLPGNIPVEVEAMFELHP
ncbi:Enamine deaminase RidA, house cleaning of reactive enamine intermediates, YjgF/YER057c/UK114 family [Flagellimonas taeanensis]|uniref:Enamine deaminase RidA, house cleaning of reactive enamine intermediates, YjgF/YER057c/UK114 family n=1 Tax=Flagellimonas taeanensis TaxID=1005926 RepID=A0A1M7BZ26_9FLAO|nr:RidA family protein [Allomuricauda taeanensis]MEE1964019.1 RidA family protein [Allomuricauda taeanensis]SFC50960.1 Enamine deaminase RidA, house cleaning of reactive enamine intermediates, YjgF/YER057c/UK114 family [Allomuricauda taeanensis]SHL60231.1 Enamine deaminase RidA, house cleaning of reactive enamine intermediates, YjgF/YER057c/UK114 family [Allomuricauda taeanensis]